MAPGLPQALSRRAAARGAVLPEVRTPPVRRRVEPLLWLAHERHPHCAPSGFGAVRQVEPAQLLVRILIDDGRDVPRTSTLSTGASRLQKATAPVAHAHAASHERSGHRGAASLWDVHKDDSRCRTRAVQRHPPLAWVPRGQCCAYTTPTVTHTQCARPARPARC
eukprot:4697634-Prymnesium_polylepis.2